MQAHEVQLASRSAGGETALYQPCCLRCSKCIFSYSHEYTRKDNLVDQQCAFPKGKYTNCNECTAKSKKCEEVPPSYRAKVNTLMRLREELDACEDDDRRGVIQERLTRKNLQYTKEVQSFLLREKRLGKSHEPHDTKEAIMALHSIIASQTLIMGQMLDAYRFVNHLPPLDEVVRDSEDSATDEDVADTTQAKGKNLGKGKGVARGPLRPAPVLKKKKKQAQSESGTAKASGSKPVVPQKRQREATDSDDSEIILPGPPRRSTRSRAAEKPKSSVRTKEPTRMSPIDFGDPFSDTEEFFRSKRSVLPKTSITLEGVKPAEGIQNVGYIPTKPTKKEIEFHKWRRDYLRRMFDFLQSDGRLHDESHINPQTGFLWHHYARELSQYPDDYGKNPNFPDEPPPDDELFEAFMRGEKIPVLEQPPVGAQKAFESERSSKGSKGKAVETIELDDEKDDIDV